MVKTEIIMIIVAAVLAVAFMAFRVSFAHKNASLGVVAMLIKALASLGFIAVGIAGIYCGVSNIKAASFILFGLIMGLVGDIVLDLKVIYRGENEEGIYLTGGMTAFAIGHAFFLTALILLLGKQAFNGGIVGICLAVAAVLDAAMMIGGKCLFRFDFGNFLIHSIIYAFCLLFMTAISFALYITTKEARMLQFAIGMLFFLVSDVFLSDMYFGGRPRDNTLCILNHGTYYAAQICIAAFIFVM